MNEQSINPCSTVELTNEPSVNSSSTNDLSRCQHRTRRGRSLTHHSHAAPGPRLTSHPMPLISHAGPSSSFLCRGGACPPASRCALPAAVPLLWLPLPNSARSASRRYPFPLRRSSQFAFRLSTLNFQPSTLFSASRRTLLHLRSQSILSLLTEDSDANRCSTQVVHRWNRRRDYFVHFGERAAARPKTLFRNALTLHRAVPRSPHGGHLRRAASAERFLHGCRHWRCLDDHRFWTHMISELW